ncbi:MAG: hypothetical protein ACREXY_04980, partial [Gammaproteobacteria bacterium]
TRPVPQRNVSARTVLAATPATSAATMSRFRGRDELGPLIPVFTLVSIVDPCVGKRDDGLSPVGASSSPSPGLVTSAKIDMFGSSAASKHPRCRDWIRHVIGV